MKNAIWAGLGILSYIALVAILFYVYPEPSKCMNLSYLPCSEHEEDLWWQSIR